MRIVFICFLFILTGCNLITKRTASESNSTVSTAAPAANVALPDEKEIAEEDPELPKEMNQLVLKQMEFFLGRGRDLMTRYLERSTRFIHLVKATLKEEGVPEDLAYVALIESGFNSTAKSRAKAVGYWQFIRGTGIRYGLKVDSLVDERRDPIRSTVAAARYLKGLYNLFGSWHLAFAAYNVGENRVKYQVMKHQTRDLWELISKGGLPHETKQYVPKFIAARMIAKHPEKYGFKDLDFDKPVTFDVVHTDHSLSMSQVAKIIGVPTQELRIRNPMYKTDLVPVGYDGQAEIRIPVDVAGNVAVALIKSQVSPRQVAAASAAMAASEYVIYKVKRGDTLASIANRFGTRISHIRQLNNFSRRTIIVAGTKIKVPPGKVRKIEKTRYTKVFKFKEPKTIHIVRRGETLTKISRKYGVSLAEIRRENRLRSHAQLYAGVRLIIPD